VNRDARLVDRESCPVIRDPRLPGNANLLIGEFEASRKTPEKLAIRKYFLLCCERLNSISNNWLAIKSGMMVAPREARSKPARHWTTTPHKSVSDGLKANPLPPRKFGKPAIFSTPARS